MDDKDQGVVWTEVVLLPRDLIGQRAWGGRIGVGSMLTVEFGRVKDRYQKRSGEVVDHGEWHLWLYGCSWSIRRDGVDIATSDHDRDVMSGAASLLDDKLVESVTSGRDGRLELRFQGMAHLVAVPGADPEMRHWSLFMPDGRVVVAGPREAWSVSRKV